MHTCIASQSCSLSVNSHTFFARFLELSVDHLIKPLAAKLLQKCCFVAAMMKWCHLWPFLHSSVHVVTCDNISLIFRYVGMPSIRTVSVINPHTEQNLQLQSISGSTAHFHASFFLSKVSYLLGILGVNIARRSLIIIVLNSQNRVQIVKK